LIVTVKDLRQIVRDRRAVVFLLLMPLAFTIFFGLAFSGIGGGGADARLQIGVIDDDGAPLAGRLVRALEASVAVRPDALGELRRAYAAELVSRGDEAAVLVIPHGWSASFEAGAPRPLELIADAGSATGLAAQRGVQATVDRVLDAERTAAAAATLLAPLAQASADTLHSRALELATAAWQDPPVRVAAVQAGASEGTATGARAGTSAGDTGAFGANPYDQASPGMIVQFAVYGLLLSAMVLVIERKQGAHARLLATPVPRVAVVVGHGMAMLTVVLAQILVLEAFGQVALGVRYLQHPWATLALTLALALWSASLGMLIGAFARTEQQVVASGLLALFFLSGLGGAWFPLEITGPTFTAVGHLTPTAWAMDAYRAILLRGEGLSGVVLPLLVLLGFSAAFFALAVAQMARRPN
jgi:ABC-2 type transport system permease protein